VTQKLEVRQSDGHLGFVVRVGIQVRAAFVQPLGELLVRVRLNGERLFNGKDFEKKRQLLGRQVAQVIAWVPVDQVLKRFLLQLVQYSVARHLGVGAHPELGERQGIVQCLPLSFVGRLQQLEDQTCLPAFASGVVLHWALELDYLLHFEK